MVLHGFVANVQYSKAIVIHILSYWYILFKLELLSQEMGGGGGIIFFWKIKGPRGTNFVEIFGPGGHFLGGPIFV